jgi:hypothetical protein
LCLEVAQLLDPSHASQLVRSLTTLSDVIVFSAAIPGQGGLGHVNEQWPRYWANLFAQRSWIATDPFRLRIWEEPDVKWWFAQNTICFASTQALPRLPALQDHVCPSGSPPALVHPGCLGAVIETYASPPQARQLPRRWRR